MPIHRFLTDTEVHAGNVFEDEQQDARDNERVGRDCSDLGELLANLHAVAVDTTRSGGGTIESADFLVSKDTSKEGSHHAADAVELEDVETFVDAQPVVEILEGSANDSCEESDDGCEPHGYVASGGCDADKASDSAFTGANNGEFSLCADVVDDDPADGTGRSGDVGVEGGVPIRHVSYRSKCGTAESFAYIARTVALRVEPPLNPNQPNQMKTVPRKTSVVLWGLPWDGWPALLRLPSTKA